MNIGKNSLIKKSRPYMLTMPKETSEWIHLIGISDQ